MWSCLRDDGPVLQVVWDKAKLRVGRMKMMAWEVVDEKADCHSKAVCTTPLSYFLVLPEKRRGQESKGDLVMVAIIVISQSFVPLEVFTLPICRQ
jgi:hypothetical protein